MKNNILLMIVLNLFLSTACVKEETSNTTSVIADTQIKKGAVPKDRLVHKVIFTPSDFTMEQMDVMYKNDISTADTDNVTNLKNMWFVVLNKKLIKEGTDIQKRFYINEQLKMENNLPNIKGFYDLLRSSSFAEFEKFDLAERFSTRNKDVVERLYSDDAKLKAEKITELIYAKRNFERFVFLK